MVHRSPEKFKLIYDLFYNVRQMNLMFNKVEYFILQLSEDVTVKNTDLLKLNLLLP